MTTTSAPCPKPQPQPQLQHPQNRLGEPRLVASPISQPSRVKGPTTNVQDISESISNLNVTIASRVEARSIPKSKTSPKSKKTKKMDDRRDVKTAPSRASGGIPSASPQYLANCEGFAQPIPTPQHLLVVIDLNGTILFRPNRKNPHKFVARPHALRFLQYCIDTFNVVIWSSARPENVNAIVDSILSPPLKKRCVAIWGRDRFNLTAADYNMRVQCYKRLNTIWSDPGIARSHPEFQNGASWNQSNTVLVDDSVEKGRSEPFNIIPLPEYYGDENERSDILPQVHDYLNQLSLHSNVSAFMRLHPFMAQAAAQGPPPGYTGI
ncbi:putative FCP1 homology domain-containing protein [Lachnellula subtilissima]|uniref:Mitochondrial import inner membrane translocase subunit TIM50 n=1 Tax=Lachnellula subtilissima TaxID=602034 RepID=A0A8H8RDL4_9HELO|nr:putative FCP1 homology domain-containing protein [Lachnellula subtilissima]